MSMPPRSLPEEADRMVAVDDPDPPPEAKIKTESTAAPSSALPSVAAASAWGEKSTDELPDDNDETYGEAEEHHAYAYGRAEASFRRFAKRMLQRDAVRIANVMPPLRTAHRRIDSRAGTRA